MTTPALHSISLPSLMLERDFWLYVGRIHTGTDTLLYVGRTGDESSRHASAPYDRFGQHLWRNKNANALRRNLEKHGLKLDQIDSYDFVFYGPLFPEVEDFEAHKPLRDTVAALEKQLSDMLTLVGYNVLNKVNCRRPFDLDLWKKVREAFTKDFPELLSIS